MQNLPWLPRPLIIWAMIGDKQTPCVQWHGQDKQGNATEGQILFPLFGEDTMYVECVRADFWRVQTISHDAKGFPWVAIVGNELGQHVTTRYTCDMRSALYKGELRCPYPYHNADVYLELPRHECDRELQNEWRLPYRMPGVTDVEQSLSRHVFADNCHIGLYDAWLAGHEAKVRFREYV